MTPDQKIDEALDAVLRASGSALRHYTTPGTLAKMREAMRKIMIDAHIAGVNSAHEAQAVAADIAYNRAKGGELQLREAARTAIEERKWGNYE